MVSPAVLLSKPREQNNRNPKELSCVFHIGTRRLGIPMANSGVASGRAHSTSNRRGGDQLIPLWVRVVVVIGALLMAAGGIIAIVNPAMLASPREQINGAVHIYAGYLFSRNVSLALILLVVLIMRATRALSQLMVLTAFIQVADAAIDCAEGRWPVVPGILVLGIVFFLGAARLTGHPFWKAEAWR